MSEAAAMTHYTETEKTRFKLLERVCVEGCQVFYLVGMALTEIRDCKLFAIDGFKDFADYCQSIGYTARYCNQLALGAEVVKSLPNEMQKLIKNESAARALAKIPEILRPAVVEKASASGKKLATASAIKKATPAVPPRIVSPPPRVKSKPVAQKKTEEPKQLDFTGIEIPKEIAELWNRGSEADELVMYLGAAKQKLERFRDAKDPLFTEVDFNQSVANLKQVLTDIRRSVPFAVCHSCNGKMAGKCLTCRGRGFVSEFYWASCVPEEARKLRPKGWKGNA